MHQGGSDGFSGGAQAWGGGGVGPEKRTRELRNNFVFSVEIQNQLFTANYSTALAASGTLGERGLVRAVAPLTAEHQRANKTKREGVFSVASSVIAVGVDILGVSACCLLGRS